MKVAGTAQHQTPRSVRFNPHHESHFYSPLIKKFLALLISRTRKLEIDCANKKLRPPGENQF